MNTVAVGQMKAGGPEWDLGNPGALWKKTAVKHKAIHPVYESAPLFMTAAYETCSIFWVHAL